MEGEGLRISMALVHPPGEEVRESVVTVSSLPLTPPGGDGLS